MDVFRAPKSLASKTDKYNRALAIKKLLDDNHPQYDIDTGLTVAEVWIDSGKAKADGHDQRGTVRVVQKPAPFAPVRYGSIAQEWDANNSAYHGLVSGMGDATRRGVGAPEPEDERWPSPSAQLKDDDTGSMILGAECKMEPSEWVTGGIYDVDEHVSHAPKQGSERKQKQGKLSEKREKFVPRSPRGKANPVIIDSDIEMFESPSIGASRFNRTKGFGDSSKPKQTGGSKQNTPIKPFKEVEAEFSRGRAATVAPDSMPRGDQGLDSPFKDLLAAQRKRKRGETNAGSMGEPNGSTPKQNVRHPDVDNPRHKRVMVVVDPKHKVEAELGDTTTPGGRANHSGESASTGRAGNKSNLPRVMLSRAREAPLFPARGNDKGGKKSEVKSASFTRRAESSPQGKTPSSQPRANCNVHKPVPPARVQVNSQLPTNLSQESMTRLLDRTAMDNALRAAKNRGATEDHLRQVEVVQGLVAKYRQATEIPAAEQNSKTIEKLRAAWEREDIVLQQKEVESAEKLDKSKATASRPSTSNRQFLKPKGAISPTTPPKKERISENSASKKATSAKKSEIFSSSKKSGKDTRSVRSTRASSPRYAGWDRTTISESDEVEELIRDSNNENGRGSPGLSILPSRSSKRRRMRKPIAAEN